MIYMDNSATSPVKEEVFNAMVPFLKEEFGNPSTFYSLGRNAKKALEEARKNVANLINADVDEIIFTSGGTESDNMAIKGIAYKLENKGKHIITSIIEHPAVKETCEYLERKGFDVTYLPVKENGIINIDDLKAAIREDTILISIMHANNEIGTIQPIEEIGKIAKENNIIFHCDAVQSVGKIPVDVKKANIDLLSISSHKIYGPKGVGALFIRKRVKLERLIHGGGQENGIRSGTENMPGIVGFGKACELINKNLKANTKKLIEIRDKLIDEVLNNIDAAYLNGDKDKRLPNNVNFRFSAIEGESLVLMLDAKGINGATGSACSSKNLKASYVLSALGIPDVDIHGSLRLSLGAENSIDDVDTVVKAIKESVDTLRTMSPLWDNDKKLVVNCEGESEYCKMH